MKKQNKASILAVTLIVLSIVLLTALTISGVALRQRMASLGSGRSNQAFQNADTGVEDVMNKIVKNPNLTVGNLGLACSDVTGQAVLESSAGEYKTELKSNTIANTDCSTVAKNIDAIKSTGFGSNQDSRAIEAAVAAVGGPAAWTCSLASTTSANRIDCPAGYKTISGGCWCSGGNTIAESHPTLNGSTWGWVCYCGNGNAAGAYAECCQ